MLHMFTSNFFFLGSIVVRGQGILYPWQIRKWSINLVVTDKTLKKIQFTKNSVYQTLLYCTQQAAGGAAVLYFTQQAAAGTAVLYCTQQEVQLYCTQQAA